MQNCEGQSSLLASREESNQQKALSHAHVLKQPQYKSRIKDCKCLSCPKPKTSPCPVFTLCSTLHSCYALTLFVAACISRQEEHRGTGEFEGPGLLGVQTLSIQVEAVRWVQPGHTPRQSHALGTQHAHTHGHGLGGEDPQSHQSQTVH